MCCYYCPDVLLWGDVAWWPAVYKLAAWARCGCPPVVSARAGRLYGTHVANVHPLCAHGRIRS